MGLFCVLICGVLIGLLYRSLLCVHWSLLCVVCVEGGARCLSPALHKAGCVSRSPLCSGRSLLCANRSLLCANRSLACANRSLLSANRSLLCANRSLLRVHRSVLCVKE